MGKLNQTKKGLSGKEVGTSSQNKPIIMKKNQC